MVTRLLSIGLILALAACSGNDDPRLMNITQPSIAGPDEFGILPAKPLEKPDDPMALPPPTLGGSNRADLTPEQDVVVALGGDPAALTRGASGDAALLNYTGRYGRDPSIRARLAAADLEFRRENNGLLFERLTSRTVYYKAYEPFELDQYAELERLRQAGVRTSSVPPTFDQLNR